MNLLRHKERNEPGTVRWMTGEEMDEWRRKVVQHLNSTDVRDRGRFRYESLPGYTEGIEPVYLEEYVGGDTVMLEKPAPQKPEEGRVVVEQMVRDTVAQWLEWKRTNPELFRRKVEELRLSHFAHLTTEQAENQIEAMCRALEQELAQATYKRLKIGGGWKGPVILNEPS